MRCKFCSAPLPKNGLVCLYCGQRNPLNLDAITKIDIMDKKSSYNCPVCNIPMENIDIGRTKETIINRCNKCDGMFVSDEILDQLMKSKRVLKKDFDPLLLRFIQDNPRQQKEIKITYRKCPICSDIMNRVNYKLNSGVIVDICIKHGIWLDGGELRQLIEWRDVGGEHKAFKVNTSTNKSTTNKTARTMDPALNTSLDNLGILDAVAFIAKILTKVI